MNRRSFLRVLGAAAAAPLVAKLLPKAPAPVPDTITMSGEHGLQVGWKVRIISSVHPGHTFLITRVEGNRFTVAPDFGQECSLEQSGLGSFPVDPKYTANLQTERAGVDVRFDRNRLDLLYGAMKHHAEYTAELLA